MTGHIYDGLQDGFRPGWLWLVHKCEDYSAHYHNLKASCHYNKERSDFYWEWFPCHGQEDVRGMYEMGPGYKHRLQLASDMLAPQLLLIPRSEDIAVVKELNLS